MTIKEIIEDMYGKMEQKERTDGTKYYCMKDDTYKHIIFKAHLDRMPSDDIYSRINDILGHLSNYDCETIEQCQDALIELEPDCYTSDLTAWLHDDNRNVYYLDDAISNGCTDGFSLLAWAQKAYIDEIAYLLLAEIEEIAI